jgi:hypothetical protein
VVLDMLPKTFNRVNTCVSRASWNAFRRRHPEKSFEEFWEFCCHYQSLHSYPLRFIMIRNDNSKVALLNREAHEAPLVKEELPAEDDASHCFVYDFAKNHGG